MADKILGIHYSIPVGKYLKLGYRPIGTPSFSYVNPNPFFNQSPYLLTVNDAFTYEFELSTICEGDCGGETSPPVYIQEVP